MFAEKGNGDDDDVNQFARPPTKIEDDDEDDGNSTSQCEIVESVFDATFTQTANERDSILSIQYGDLPKDQWKGRKEQEKHWVSGKLSLLEAYSAPLNHSDSCYVVGTNGIVAIAVVAKDWPVDPKKEEEEEEAKEEKHSDRKTARRRAFEAMEEAKRERGTQNAVFAYKLQQSRFESDSFYQSLRFQLDTRITTQKGAREVINSLLNLSKMDLTLRDAVERIGPLLTNKHNNLPETAPAPKMMSANRPGGLPRSFFVGYEFVALCPEDMAWNSADSRKDPDTTVFQIRMCDVPNSSEEKEKTWHSVNNMIVCKKTNGVVPAVAFNATHMVILYQPHGAGLKQSLVDGLIFVDLFGLSNPGKRLDRFAFVFPSYFSGVGFMHVTLSRLGIFSVGFSLGAVVFDVFRTIKIPRIFILKHDDDSEEEAEGEKKKKKRRRHRITVTSVSIVHPHDVHERPNGGGDDALDEYLFNDNEDTDVVVPDVPRWCGHIMLGTHRGECFTFCWRSGTRSNTEMIPGIQPVFSTHYSNGRLILHGVDSMSGSISNVGPHTIVPLRRPLALTTCGSLIYVLSKYGEIMVFDSFARQFCRPFNAPPPPSKGDESQRLLLLQHRYEGIVATPMSVVAVYPNGVIRRISLPPKDKWERLEREAERKERREMKKARAAAAKAVPKATTTAEEAEKEK
jgi:hypothetical protein